MRACKRDHDDSCGAAAVSLQDDRATVSARAPGVAQPERRAGARARTACARRGGARRASEQQGSRTRRAVDKVKEEVRREEDMTAVRCPCAQGAFAAPSSAAHSAQEGARACPRAHPVPLPSLLFKIALLHDAALQGAHTRWAAQARRPRSRCAHAVAQRHDSCAAPCASRCRRLGSRRTPCAELTLAGVTSGAQAGGGQDKEAAGVRSRRYASRAAAPRAMRPRLRSFCAQLARLAERARELTPALRRTARQRVSVSDHRELVAPAADGARPPGCAAARCRDCEACR